MTTHEDLDQKGERVPSASSGALSETLLANYPEQDTCRRWIRCPVLHNDRITAYTSATVPTSDDRAPTTFPP